VGAVDETLAGRHGTRDGAAAWASGRGLTSGHPNASYAHLSVTILYFCLFSLTSCLKYCNLHLSSVALFFYLKTSCHLFFPRPFISTFKSAILRLVWNGEIFFYSCKFFYEIKPIYIKFLYHFFEISAFQTNPQVFLPKDNKVAVDKQKKKNEKSKADEMESTVKETFLPFFSV
jgi:hypothetical protein